MTNEKAIEAIKFGHCDDIYYRKEYEEAVNMAIKALEQKPCEDAISRQAAIDAVEKTKSAMATDGEIYVAKINAEMNIQQLPSVSTEKTWIPVSEKLPKENEYIVDVCKYYLIQDEYGDMHVAHLSKVGWIPMDSLKAIGNEVIAWCELPQPYKGESGDKE